LIYIVFTERKKLA